MQHSADKNFPSCNGWERAAAPGPPTLHRLAIQVFNSKCQLKRQKKTEASSQQSSRNRDETTSMLQVGWDIYKLIAHPSLSHATAGFFLPTM